LKLVAKIRGPKAQLSLAPAKVARWSWRERATAERKRTVTLSTRATGAEARAAAAAKRKAEKATRPSVARQQAPGGAVLLRPSKVPPQAPPAEGPAKPTALIAASTLPNRSMK